MTYTFKLARRLAVSRDFAMIAALALLVACMEDSTGPAGEPSRSPDPPFLQVSPRSVTIETNQTVRFRGEGRNARGADVVSAMIAWEASGGEISTDGTFSSSTVGAFKVVGRGRGWKKSDTSIVVVVPPQPGLTEITIDPLSTTLTPGATREFTATGHLSDGTTGPVGVTWSATGGTVDPAGSYQAGQTAGAFRIIAANTAGTIADTAAITISASSPTLAEVIVTPASVSLTTAETKLFKAYGRKSNGDSVSVAVSFSATGGSVASGGLYTAGQTTGSFRVIATSSGLADTAAVSIVASPTSTTPTGTGIPFGPSSLWTGYTTTQTIGTTSFTSGVDGINADGIVRRIDAARAKGIHLLVNMTGGSHDNYLTNGVFDRAKWNAKMETYNTSTIRQAVAAAVADGTIIGNSVMDEPHVYGQGDGNTWGPQGTMTKARVDSMCVYAKRIFPTLPVGVTHGHDAFEPTKSYRVCEFIIDQYSWRKGSVTEFRDAGLALARRDGMSIVFSLNIINGGIQAARDGLWNCSLTTTGGRGTYDPNCRMTPQQVRDWGITLGSAGCALNMWRYDSEFMSKAENQRAFSDVAQRLATLPRKACRRQ
jgi:hypothetical protein